MFIKRFPLTALGPHERVNAAAVCVPGLPTWCSKAKIDLGCTTTLCLTCVFEANVGTNNTNDESATASKVRTIANLFIRILPLYGQRIARATIQLLLTVLHKQNCNNINYSR